jgi:peptidoglycan/LPS O-acetylase OafA/YrhL
VTHPRPEAPVVQAGETRSARIEGLRALAALGVVASHLVLIGYGFNLPDLDTHPVQRAAFAGGANSVDLFFVLTGYLLYLPFARRDLSGGPRIDLGGYALNRVLRIVPLYLAAVAVLLVINHHGGSLRQWLVLTTFSGNFDNSHVGDVLPVSWSLVVELHFYLLLPLIAAGLARAGRGSARRTLALLALGAALSIVYRRQTLYVVDQQDPALVFSLAGTFFLLAAGMALAVVRLAWERKPPRLPAWCTRTDLWVVVSIALWIFSTRRFIPERELMVAPAAFLVVGACVLPLRPGALVRLLSWRWLSLLGIASYSLYIWHYAVLLWVADLYPGSAGVRVLTLLGVPAVIAVSAVSYLILERPFLRRRRSWARPPAPAVGSERVGVAL